MAGLKSTWRDSTQIGCSPFYLGVQAGWGGGFRALIRGVKTARHWRVLALHEGGFETRWVIIGRDCYRGREELFPDETWFIESYLSTIARTERPACSSLSPSGKLKGDWAVHDRRPMRLPGTGNPSKFRTKWNWSVTRPLTTYRIRNHC